jgi:hypothetical protein
MLLYLSKAIHDPALSGVLVQIATDLQAQLNVSGDDMPANNDFEGDK